MYAVSKSKNAVVVYLNGIGILFSYGVPVAAYIPGRGYLRTAKKWSMTTTRHINAWFAEIAEGYEVEEVSQDTLDYLL